MDDFLDKEERVTNSKTTIEETTDNYHNRQFRYRLRSQFTTNANSWILNKRGTTTVNQRKRVDEHLFCAEVTRAKLQKLQNQDFNRQQDINKIYNKGRRYNLSSPTRLLCSKDTGYLQSLQSKGEIPAYPRHKQYCGEPTFENEETIIREYDLKKIIPKDSTKMGSTKDRHVCVATKYTTLDILLESETKPANSSSRRLFTKLDKNGPICLSAVETDSTSTITDKEKADDLENSSGGSLAINTILVSNAVWNEEIGQTNNLQEKLKDNISRMAIIRRIHQQKGLSQDAMRFLDGTHRSGTNRAYDNG